MMILVKPLRFLTIQGLDILYKLQKPLIGLIVLALGVLLGYLHSSPESAELTISIISICAVMAIVMYQPLYGVLVWLMFEPFIETWVNVPMGAGIPDLSFSRFTIAFLAIFMLAKSATGKFRFVRISLADLCILLTTIGVMLAAPMSVEFTGTIQHSIAMYFTPLAAYFFAKNLVRDKRDLHKLLGAVALLGFVAGVYAAYEHATGNVLFLQKGDQVGAVIRENLDIRMIKGLIGGTGNMGRALAASIPVTFYLLLEEKKNNTRRSLLIVMLAAQFYGIVIAMSRTPWYALLIALFVMQFFYPQFRKVFFAITFVAIIILGLTWDQVSESDVANRVNDKVSTLEGREARWTAGFNMWKAKPVRGWGFDRYETHSGRFRTDGVNTNFRNGAIENDYLHIMVSCGLIGFVPYALFLLVPLVNSLRLFFRARASDWSGFIKPEVLSVYWAVIICLLITSYTAIQTQAIIRLMTFAVAGAIVGSHEHVLGRSKNKALPATKH
jgi:O-antigen ligase